MWCANKACHCILYWKQERHLRTIPWDPSINVTRIRSAQSSNTYRVFVAAYEQERSREDIEHICYSKVVSYYEDE